MPRKIIVFTAKWCGPCSRYKPTLESLKGEGAEIEMVDVDADAKSVKKFTILSVPTTVVLEDEVEIERLTGVVGEDKLKEVLNLNKHEKEQDHREGT